MIYHSYLIHNQKRTIRSYRVKNRNIIQMEVKKTIVTEESTFIILIDHSSRIREDVLCIFERSNPFLQQPHSFSAVGVGFVH